MRVIPVDLIQFDDATWWLRHGSRMMRVDETDWLTAGEAPAAHEGDATLHGRARKDRPSAWAIESRKLERETAGAPPIPVPVESPKGGKTPRTPTPAKVAAKLRREAGLPGKKKRVKPDEAKVARARKLVEHQGYTLKRAAAAVEMNYATLYGRATREGWDVPKRGTASVPEPKLPTEKSPRQAVRCPNCKRKTETSPCRHCFEKVPELTA
jgi:hypothetical protein